MSLSRPSQLCSPPFASGCGFYWLDAGQCFLLSLQLTLPKSAVGSVFAGCQCFAAFSDFLFNLSHVPRASCYAVSRNSHCVHELLHSAAVTGETQSGNTKVSNRCAFASSSAASFTGSCFHLARSGFVPQGELPCGALFYRRTDDASTGGIEYFWKIFGSGPPCVVMPTPGL